MADLDKYLSPATVAEMFEVNSATVRKWIKDGKLKAIKLDSGILRVSESEVKRLANKMYGSDDDD